MSHTKNLSIIEHILENCIEIKKVHREYGQDAKKYRVNIVYKNSIAFNLLQIGELAGQLSDEYRDIHKEIPWQQIRALRNRIVHGYGTANKKVLWKTSVEDIDGLVEFCKSELAGDGNDWDAKISGIRTIQQITDIVTPIMQSYGVETAGLFGPYARGEATEDSDIDIIVNAEKVKGLDFVGLWEDIEEKLEKHVVLISHTGSYADKKLQENAAREEIRIYES